MITTNVPSVVDEETGAYPPLGLLYVAAYLEQHSSHQVEILDCILERFNQEQIEAEIRQRKPDAVGISVTTFTLIDAIQTAKTVKKVDPSIVVILGGPHVYIYPKETLEIPEVDFVVLGEGEIIFTELVNALEQELPLPLREGRGEGINNPPLPTGEGWGEGKNKDWYENIPGIGFRHNNEIIITPLRPLNQNLDDLPFPARRLLPWQRYYTVLAHKTPITTMMTSRGCPMKCIFCDRPHLGKQFRYRSAESVVQEMQLCEEMGIGEIFIYDDTFSINRQRVLDICRLKIERKLRIGWDIRAHINTITEEMLDALAAAGCLRIHYGVESGNQEIIKVIRKGIDLEKTKHIFKQTQKRGIDTLGYFMIGNPSETREQALETIAFAKSLAADYIHLSVCTPFPATELYQLGFERGIFTEDYWREFARNPQPDFVPRLWEEYLTRDELIDLMQLGYRQFYFRPKYLAKRLLAIHSWPELKRKAKAGLRLLRWKKE